MCHFLYAEMESTQTIQAHNHEVLTCDWNKYNDFLIATGSVDKTIRIWVRSERPKSTSALAQRTVYGCRIFAILSNRSHNWRDIPTLYVASSSVRIQKVSSRPSDST